MADVVVTTKAKMVEIPLDQLVPTEGNRSRGGIDKDKLKDLASSIESVGVLQPAVVQVIGPGRYQIVAGERRFRAAALAGLKTLPCVVRDDLTDQDIEEIQLIENLQREDVHPLDEADWYARLAKRGVSTVESIANRVGKPVSYVHQRIKLLDLITAARKLFEAGKIQLGHALATARLPPAQQKLCVEILTRRGYSFSLSEFTRWIARDVIQDLAGVAFSKSDASLYPKAGACTTCPKRTGYAPSLFPDISKGDRCLDPACFNTKLDALLAGEEAKLKDGGEPYLRVVDQLGDYTADRPRDALRSYEWTEVDSDSDGAVPCLIVAGPHRGKIVFGKQKASTVRAGGNTSPAARAAEKTKRIRERALSVQRRGFLDLTISAIKKEIAAKRGGFPEDVLRTLGGRLWVNTDRLLQMEVCKSVGWNPPKPPKANGYQPSIDWRAVGLKAMKTMKPQELAVFMVRVMLAGDPHQPGYFYSARNGNRKKEVDLLAVSRKVKPPALVIPKATEKKSGKTVTK